MMHRGLCVLPDPLSINEIRHTNPTHTLTHTHTHQHTPTHSTNTHTHTTTHPHTHTHSHTQGQTHRHTQTHTHTHTDQHCCQFRYCTTQNNTVRRTTHPQKLYTTPRWRAATGVQCLA